MFQNGTPPPPPEEPADPPIYYVAQLKFGRIWRDVTKQITQKEALWQWKQAFAHKKQAFRMLRLTAQVIDIDDQGSIIEKEGGEEDQ